MNRHFTKDVQVPHKHIKRFSASVVIREMQRKTMTRGHFTPARMADVEKVPQRDAGGGVGSRQAAGAHVRR